MEKIKKEKAIFNLADFSQQEYFSKIKKNYLGAHAYVDVCMLLRLKCELYVVYAFSAVLMRIYSLDGKS